MEHDEMHKVATLGEVGVGKSSLLVRFADGALAPDGADLRGLDYKLKTVEVQGARLRLQLWDTGGQERFRTITSSYYRGAHGLALVYDVSDRLSFEELETWRAALSRFAEGAAVLVLGNKIDLPRAVDQAEAEAWARKHGFLYAEVSAAFGTNVDAAFLLLAAELHRRHQQRYSASSLRVGSPRHSRRSRRRC
jgi:Ras-related protein Rab-1A